MVVGCQLICEIFSAYFHSCGFVGLAFVGGRRWLAVLGLSSGRAFLAGDTIPVTSLYSGGRTLDGDQSHFRCSPPSKHSLTGGEPQSPRYHSKTQARCTEIKRYSGLTIHNIYLPRLDSRSNRKFIDVGILRLIDRKGDHIGYAIRTDAVLFVDDPHIFGDLIVTDGFQ